MNYTVTHLLLHDALAELDETHEPQVIKVPKRLTPQYFQKYTHMLAERRGMRIVTRAARGPRAVHMMITERAS
jgi:hypothetical protein